MGGESAQKQGKVYGGKEGVPEQDLYKDNCLPNQPDGEGRKGSCASVHKNWRIVNWGTCKRLGVSTQVDTTWNQKNNKRKAREEKRR